MKGTFFLHVKGRQKLIGELLSRENELVNRDIGTKSNVIIVNKGRYQK